jgi:hypothetical protein
MNNSKLWYKIVMQIGRISMHRKVIEIIGVAMVFAFPLITSLGINEYLCICRPVTKGWSCFLKVSAIVVNIMQYSVSS